MYPNDQNYQTFIAGIHNKTKVKLSFLSKEDGKVLVRLCAPMDFGPSRRAKDKADRYHFWDYESDTKNHVLTLVPEQIDKIELTNTSFEPVEFITWDVQKSPWFIKRNWGLFS